MIHIIKIHIDIKLSSIRTLFIEKSNLSLIPRAIIFDGHLYTLQTEYYDRFYYGLRKLSISDYIKSLMDLCPDNTYYIAYV